MDLYFFFNNTIHLKKSKEEWVYHAVIKLFGENNWESDRNEMKAPSCSSMWLESNFNTFPFFHPLHVLPIQQVETDTD